jgi:hypothetical protein
MKTIIFILLLPILSLAQENLSLSNSSYGKLEKKRNWGFGFTLDSTDSDVGLHLTYILNDKISLGLGYGVLIGKSGTAGGNLEDWQYVEETKIFRAEHLAINLTYMLGTTINQSGFFVDGALGFMRGGASYSYYRYKPDNAFFFPGDKAVEENSQASGSLSSTYSTIATGYSWSLFSKEFGTFNIRLFANYLMLFENKSEMISSISAKTGLERGARFGTDLLSTGTISVSMNFLF